MKLKYFGKTFNLKPIKDTYARDNSLAVILIDTKVDDIFDCLTVNIAESILLKDNEAFVDTNNNPWATEFIEDNKLGKFTGRYGHSGYCTYPLYQFDLQKLNK